MDCNTSLRTKIHYAYNSCWFKFLRWNFIYVKRVFMDEMWTNQKSFCYAQTSAWLHQKLISFCVIYHSADILNMFSHTIFLSSHLPFCRSSLTRSCQLLCHTIRSSRSLDSGLKELYYILNYKIAVFWTALKSIQNPVFKTGECHILWIIWYFKLKMFYHFAVLFSVWITVGFIQCM